MISKPFFIQKEKQETFQVVMRNFPQKRRKIPRLKEDILMGAA
jgi:hypothetical protein